jgi:hypothetical protein
MFEPNDIKKFFAIVLPLYVIAYSQLFNNTTVDVHNYNRIEQRKEIKRKKDDILHNKESRKADSARIYTGDVLFLDSILSRYDSL